MKIQELTQAARVFARTKDNEEIRVVRAINSFNKFFHGDVKEKRNGDIVGYNNRGKEVAYWWADIGNGVICRKASDFKKFVALCQEGEVEEAPKRRGRPPKNAESDVVEAPKRRGRPPKNAAASNVSPTTKALIKNLRAIIAHLEEHGI